MELDPVLSEHNPVKIVVALKEQLLKALSDDRTSMLAHQKHQQLLEQQLEQIRNFMCGNFFMEPAKDIFDNLQLERELVEQDVFGFFIVNLDRLSVRVSRHLVEIFDHVITSYVYQTRLPLVETLTKHDYLLSQLCHFVCHPSDTASCASAQMLVACCEHYSLARKLIDLSANESNNLGTAFYIQLLKLVPNNDNLNQLAQIFKFLRALLLTNNEVAIYAFTRDLNQLIVAFNLTLRGQCHHYARFKCLALFGDLIQNRKLQCLIGAYTTSMDNLKLFYDWAREKLNSPECKQEFIKIFEVFRLFILNQNNQNNKEFKKFMADNYLEVNKIVDHAEQVRSYTDLGLKHSKQYEDVRRLMHQMADKEDSLNRSDSDDSI